VSVGVSVCVCVRACVHVCMYVLMGNLFMCSVYTCTIYAASSPCGGTVSTTRAHRRSEKSQSAGQGDRNPDSTLPFLCVCHTVTKFFYTYGQSVSNMPVCTDKGGLTNI